MGISASIDPVAVMHTHPESTGPQRSVGRPGPTYTNVVGTLIVPQVFASLFVVLYLALRRGLGGSCVVPCGSDLAYAANVALWIMVTVITGLTLAALLAWRRRGWRSWPIALGGVVLTLIAGFIAVLIFEHAYPL